MAGVSCIGLSAGFEHEGFPCIFPSLIIVYPSRYVGYCSVSHVHPRMIPLPSTRVVLSPKQRSRHGEFPPTKCSIRIASYLFFSVHFQSSSCPVNHVAKFQALASHFLRKTSHLPSKEPPRYFHISELRRSIQFPPFLSLDDHLSAWPRDMHS